MEHTPEPWYVGEDYYGGISIRTSPDGANNIDGRDAVFENTGLGEGDMDEADARRIVACVNACTGIPTDVLEASSVKELMAMATPPNAKEIEAAVEVFREVSRQLPPEQEISI